MLHLNGSIFGAVVNVRLAVGDGDHPPALEVAAERLLEARRRPAPGVTINLSLEREPVDELADVLHHGLKLGAMCFASNETAELVAPILPRQTRGEQGDDG